MSERLTLVFDGTPQQAHGQTPLRGAGRRATPGARVRVMSRVVPVADDDTAVLVPPAASLTSPPDPGTRLWGQRERPARLACQARLSWMAKVVGPATHTHATLEVD